MWVMEEAVSVFASLSMCELGVLVHLSFILIVVLCSDMFPETPVFPQVQELIKHLSCDFLRLQGLFWDGNCLCRVLLIAQVSKAAPVSKTSCPGGIFSVTGEHRKK